MADPKQACIQLPLGNGMAELINLRMARKRARQRQDDTRAQASRLAHGQPKGQRKFEAARREKANHDLDLQRIEKGDGR